MEEPLISPHLYLYEGRTDDQRDISNSEPIPTLSSKVAWNLVKVGCIAGFGGLLFGYNTSTIAGILLPLGKAFNMTDFEKSIVVSIQAIGCLFGCLFGGVVSDKIGRWRAMLVQNALFVLGAVILSNARNVQTLIGGRIVIGMGSAFSIVADIPYLNEISPSTFRGRLASYYEIFVVIGTVVGGITCLILQENWKLILLLPIVFIAIHTILLFLIPESPRWLIQNKLEDKAKLSLSKLLLLETSDEIELELSDLKNKVLRTNTGQTSYDVLFKEYRLPLKIVAVLIFLSQFTGAVVM